MRTIIALIIGLTLAWTSPIHAETTKLSHEEMFKQLSARAPKGDSDIKYNLGMFLSNGVGTKRDHQAALKLFSEAAAAGNALAAYQLGRYYAGQFPNAVAANDELAFKYTTIAAEAGYDLAQHDLARMLVKRGDLPGAVIWWERASRQGNDIATAFLITYYTSNSSPDKIKGHGLMLLMRDSMPDAPKKFTERLAATEAGATPEERAAAEKIRASWITGRTPLTTAGQRGISAVPELLERKARR